MTKLTTIIVTAIFVLLALAAVGPRIAAILNALVPLVLVIGIVAVVLRIVWWRTGRW